MVRVHVTACHRPMVSWYVALVSCKNALSYRGLCCATEGVFTSYIACTRGLAQLWVLFRSGPFIMLEWVIGDDVVWVFWCWREGAGAGPIASRRKELRVWKMVGQIVCEFWMGGVSLVWFGLSTWKALTGPSPLHSFPISCLLQCIYPSTHISFLATFW